MDRPDISRLNKNRGIFLQLGFVIALSLTLMAFNYTVYDHVPKEYKAPPMEEDILQEVKRTIHKEKKVPPPPVLKPTDKIIDEDVIFDPDPEPEPEEEDLFIDVEPIEPSPRPVVKKAPPPTPKIEPVEPDEVPDIFVVVEQMPRFPGCEDGDISEAELKMCADRKLMQYISSQINYPAPARENGIEGTAVVSFVVEKDGSITGMKVVREIGGGCGKEVIRIVKGMPKWIAGEQRGRKVRVQFNLPVQFRLN